MSHTARILELIAELGPQTRSEIEKALGLSKQKTSALLNKLGNRTATLPKRVYIIDYVDDCEGERVYPRAQYALGDLPDKVRTTKEKRKVLLANKRRHFEIASNRVSSVFELGVPAYQRRAKYAGLLAA